MMGMVGPALQLLAAIAGLFLAWKIGNMVRTAYQKWVTANDSVANREAQKKAQDDAAKLSQDVNKAPRP